MPTSDFEALAQDVRDAARGMARTPGFTVLVTAVLAMGLGAGTTVFSILNTLFLQPLRYPHAERLVMMGEAYTRGQQVGPIAPVRQRDYLEWRKQARSFDGIAAYRAEPFVVNAGGEPKRVRGERVAPDYFTVLGVRPLRGRGFSADDYVSGAPRVVVLSEEYWRRELHGREDAIGMTLRVDGAPATVAGIMPRRLRATADRRRAAAVEAADSGIGDRDFFGVGAAETWRGHRNGARRDGRNRQAAGGGAAGAGS